MLDLLLYVSGTPPSYKSLLVGLFIKNFFPFELRQKICSDIRKCFRILSFKILVTRIFMFDFTFGFSISTFRFQNSHFYFTKPKMKMCLKVESRFALKSSMNWISEMFNLRSHFRFRMDFEKSENVERDMSIILFKVKKVGYFVNIFKITNILKDDFIKIPDRVSRLITFRPMLAHEIQAGHRDTQKLDADRLRPSAGRLDHAHTSKITPKDMRHG